jgi:curved DNA-binding protein CbpA
VATLYDLFGVAQDATLDQLRRAYRERVRELHPDANPRAGEDAIRQLNAAWSVLGNLERRREYNATLQGPTPRRDPEESPPPQPQPDLDPVHHPFAWMLRPSALIVAVLLTILVVTAYAGSHVSDQSNPSATSSTTATASDASQVGWLINQCFLPQPGHEVVVPCSNPDSRQVVAVLSSTSPCPAATVAYRLTGRDQQVCLTSHH